MTVSVTGVHEAVAVLDGLHQRALDARPALEAAADEFRAAMRQQYATGSGWKPLTTEYALRKARRGRSSIPLAGGVLEESLTRQGARFAVQRVTADEMLVATDDPVAHLHEQRHGRRPARDPAPVSRETEDRMVDAVTAGLLGPGMVRRFGQ